jgi:REP element-mobilizing transposase RayT
VKLKLLEIHRSLQSVDSQSEDFHQLQRRYFLTTEKYLDAGAGFAPFVESGPCEACLEAVITMETEGWLVGEATVMPNHLHLLILRQDSEFSLKEILKRFKGRSARGINQALERSGRFWQEDWFDRWMRHEAELTKTIAYIRNNPVKAKLASQWRDYRWRISKEM